MDFAANTCHDLGRDHLFYRLRFIRNLCGASSNFADAFGQEQNRRSWLPDRGLLLHQLLPLAAVLLLLLGRCQWLIAKGGYECRDVAGHFYSCSRPCSCVCGQIYWELQVGDCRGYCRQINWRRFHDRVFQFRRHTRPDCRWTDYRRWRIWHDQHCRANCRSISRETPR